jgi:hypothetical protein
VFVGGWAGSGPVVGFGDGCVTLCCDTASRRYVGQLTACLAVGYAPACLAVGYAPACLAVGYAYVRGTVQVSVLLRHVMSRY